VTDEVDDQYDPREVINVEGLDWYKGPDRNNGLMVTPFTTWNDLRKVGGDTNHLEMLVSTVCMNDKCSERLIPAASYIPIHMTGHDLSRLFIGLPPCICSECRMVQRLEMHRLIVHTITPDLAEALTNGRLQDMLREAARPKPDDESVGRVRMFIETPQGRVVPVSGDSSYVLGADGRKYISVHARPEDVEKHRRDTRHQSAKWPFTP